MKAIVTGISGQDGHFMARLLLKEGNDVIGITSDPEASNRIEAEFADERMSVIAFDYSKRGLITGVIEAHRPDMFFNFAALATGSGMFSNPPLMSRINGEFVLDILEAARTVKPDMRFCQASSAEMYGNSELNEQIEDGPFKPKSPYGAAKLYAHNLVSVYRTAFRLHAVSAILFNHESIRRPMTFVTRKVAHAAARIKLGLQDELKLGALDTMRDWGYAPEYVEAMLLMAQHSHAEDFVLATGRHSTIRDLCQIAFEHVGLDYQDHVRVDTNFVRSIDTRALKGNPERIFKVLGWKARTPIADVIREMVDCDIASIEADTDRGSTAKTLDGADN